MFLSGTTFNQNISSWNVSGVTRMDGMFDRASSFNQNLGSWNVKNVTQAPQFLKDATSFTTANFDALYSGWAAQSPLKQFVTFGGPPCCYTSVGQAGRNALIASPNFWLGMTDGGLC
jgi:hypothetical protein